jgi:two-component system NtrC family sensor kinase
MAWIGWILAVAAIGAAAWLWRELGAERSHTSELLCSKMTVEDELDVLRTQQSAHGDAAPTFAAVGAQLDAPLGSVRAHLERAGTQLDDYRQRVKHFDEAVQYCLQPVELIFGADKAGLAELVRHVEGARRKLFESRGALEKNPLHNGAGALGVGLADLADLAGLVRNLQTPTPPVVPEPDPMMAEYDEEEAARVRPNHGNPMLNH